MQFRPNAAFRAGRVRALKRPPAAGRRARSRRGANPGNRSATRRGWLSVCALLAACGGRPAPLTLTGATMGTTYTVKLLPNAAPLDARSMQAAIDDLLETINDQMSTYRPDSELSRINASRVTDWLPISAELYTVLTAAQEVSRTTGGAFDITVGPLVNLWGFGPEARPRQVPDPAALAAATARVGYQQLELAAAPPRLRKRRPDLSLDLGGITPGYAVDCIAGLLDARGVRDYMVELGGEIKARGRNAEGHAWQIGIETPLPAARVVGQVVGLADRGMGASGDYRSYFEQGGVRYSHDIDPATGRPVIHPLAAVSVIHPSTMYADAYATGLMVLGPERGLALAERLGLAAVFQVHTEAGFTTRASSAFAAAAGSNG